MTYSLPPVALLSPPSDTDTHTSIANPERVEEALSNAGLSVEEVTARFAPQVIRYLVKLAPGSDPKKVERAIDGVSLAVRGVPVRYAGVHDGYVIIEQNRTQADIVNLREVIEQSEALIRLGVPLGVASTGEALTARLADMPHMLVAGTTGAGKSAFLTSTLTALLMRNSPDDLRLTLIDPKRVELAAFADAPHVAEIITDVGAAGVVLRRLAQLMDQRYTEFQDVGVKSFEEYNAQAPSGHHLTRQLLVVDELADLIITSKVCEPTLVRLAQLGRAAGIHLLLATQHPAANVLTAQLRLNIPARVVFAVQSHVASKVALDYTGAEKLRGHGDGLFKAPRVGEPVRFQAPLVSSDDVARVVAWWRKQDVDVRARAAVTGAVVEVPEGGPVTRNDVEALRKSVLGPQPVEKPVDDGADLRAEVDAWEAEAALDVESAVASLTPEEILGDAGFSPLVIQALADTLIDKIADGVEARITSMLSSGSVNTTEGDSL